MQVTGMTTIQGCSKRSALEQLMSLITVSNWLDTTPLEASHTGRSETAGQQTGVRVDSSGCQWVRMHVASPMKPCTSRQSLCLPNLWFEISLQVIVRLTLQPL